MKLTQSEVFSIIEEMKPNRTSYPDHNSLSVRIAEVLKVAVSDEIRQVVKKQLQAFKRFKKKNQNNSSLDRSQIEDDIILDTEEFGEIEEEPQVKRKKYKSFFDMSDQMRKLRTNNIVDDINNFIGNECPEITFNQLLGYLLYRENKQSNKTLKEVGNRIFNEETVELHSNFSVDEGVAFKHFLNLSKFQMRSLKYILDHKGIFFPTTNELLEARKKLRPTSVPSLNNKGVSVDYRELVQMTLKSVLNLVEKKNEYNYSQNDTFTIFFKDGCDGAGQHVVMKSTSMIDAKDNMFLYGLVVLKLVCVREDGGEIILWHNQTPNSSGTLRPVYLLREQETDAELLELVIPSTDFARTDLMENGLFEYFFDNSIHVNVMIADSMKDLKLKKKISGLGGADCILCVTKQVDWTDITSIAEGFPINRCAEDTWKLYQELVNEDGDIETSAGDFEVRKGLTKAPITKSSQLSITITHGYINGTSWFLKVLYRCHIDYRNWIKRSGPLGAPLDASRIRVLSMIENMTGLKLDVVCSAGAKGGTSTDGNSGRRLFSEEFIPCIKEISDPRYTDNLLLLHRQLSCILRINSSSKWKVNLELFEKLCHNCSLNIANYFPWALINHTMHGTIQHSAELIALNGHYGLGSLSEEGLEATNKDVRNFICYRSRKCSPIDQLNDVMSRLLERSDPCIRDIILTCHAPVKCTECGSSEHSIRSHSRHTSLPKSSYDTFVEKFYL